MSAQSEAFTEEYIKKLEAQQLQLLEALKSTRAFINSVAPYGGLLERVNAAIEAVEGKEV